MKKLIIILPFIFLSLLTGCISWDLKEFQALEDKTITYGQLNFGLQMTGFGSSEANVKAGLAIMKEFPSDKIIPMFEKKLMIKIDDAEFQKAAKNGFINDPNMNTGNNFLTGFMYWTHPSLKKAYTTEDWSGTNNWMTVYLTIYDGPGQVNLMYSICIFAKGTSSKPYRRFDITGDENLYTIFSGKKATNEIIVNNTIKFLNEKLPGIVEQRLSYFQ